MTCILVIDKGGQNKELNVKEFKQEELYKKAGFKAKEGFNALHTWEKVKTKKGLTYDKITVYGKVKGNAGKENKYELPPPLDTTLCFGSLVVVHYNEDDEAQPLHKATWKCIYNTLYGGFEDLDDDDDDEDEEEDVDPALLDKNGYLKDGFVVEDDEVIEYGDVPESTEELDNLDLDYESELSEEEYFA